MNIRIISGIYGGRKLRAPDGTTTHPMSERVRGSLFNMINTELKGAKVLDAFSGTGVIGLETLSRGASSVTFVERDRLASESLRENIQTLGVENSTTSFKMDISTWIDKNQGDSYDVIIADPPYNDTQLSTVERLASLLNPKGLMVLSYPGRSGVPQIYGIVVVDNRSYGNASLVFYRKE